VVGHHSTSPGAEASAVPSAMHQARSQDEEWRDVLEQAAEAKARGYRTTRNLIAMAYLLAGKLDFDLPTWNSEEPNKKGRPKRAAPSFGVLLRPIYAPHQMT